MSILERNDSKLASFLFRGQLTQNSIDSLPQSSRETKELDFSAVAQKVSLKELDDDSVNAATKMSAVYIAIAAFENMVRQLILDKMLEEKGADWWDSCVANDIQKRVTKKIEDEKQIRWHKPRGVSPIFFTEMKDLVSIIQNNWDVFEDVFADVEWVRHNVRALERSRNVIMHSGELSLDDIERVGVIIRDWIRQVGV